MITFSLHVFYNIAGNDGGRYYIFSKETNLEKQFQLFLNYVLFIAICICMAMARVVVFNTTFNNISATSWRSVLLMEETGLPREKHELCHKSLRNFIT